MRKKHNPAAIAGWCIILAFCLIAIFADFIAPYDPSELGTAYLKPSAEHLLGTNDLGQDIFSEMVYGTRVSLLLGVFSALLVSLIGTALALIAGYFGGTADKTICAVIDVAMAVPSLPLTMLLIAYLKSGMFSLILAISITAWTGTARILRTRVKQICELPYIKIEKAMGVSAPVIMVRHILPNLKDILLTRMAIELSRSGNIRSKELGQHPAFCLLPQQHSAQTDLVVSAADHLHQRRGDGLHARGLLWPAEKGVITVENAILDIQNVSVRFANGSAVQAVEQVSLSVFPSDKLCIIGETGSGKSILLLSVLRLLPASAVVSGDVCFHGQSLFALSPKQMDGVRGGQISYVPQGSGNGMNPLLSVGFQVGEPLIAHRGMNKKRAIARAVELMRRFHLGREEELARQYPYTLSGGMRQRALIAMGISADAELLLFDEPTKGLDEARIRLVADTLNELDGQTMVCVTHDLSFARDVANRIGVMYAANLIEVADADELYAHPLHPYTRDMLAAMPENGLHFRPGYAPAHDDTRVTGCKYRMRCPNCSEKCAEMPPMADVDGHKVRCWQYV